MEIPPITTVMTPIMQFGFAGLSLVLLGIVIWLIRQLLLVIQRNNDVVAANTHAIMSSEKNTIEARNMVIEMKNEMMKHDCGVNLR